MTPISPYQAIVEQMLSCMPPDVASGFSDRQLSALAQAMKKRNQKRHTVDIRFTIPIFNHYVVFLLGPEQRSLERRLRDRQSRRSKSMSLAIVLLMTLGGGLALLALVWLSGLNFMAFANRPPAPTEVPFKTDQASCEQSGRLWENGHCNDFGHSPEF